MNQERIFRVLLGSHFSEKSAMVGDANNQVVFKVLPNATKSEVKIAVEKLFDVKVTGVSVANVKGKTKRTRHGVGKHSDWKKAYVRLEQGQEIDFAAVE